MMNIEEVKKIAQNCLNCKNPMCVQHCPIANPIPQILSFIKQDKIKEASDLLFTHTNASPICSRLCDVERQCFGNCILKNRNQAVKFCEVEKFLSQSFYNYPSVNASNQKDVAIIGAGISGLSCAIDLASCGYTVSIFEKSNQIGGVLAQTIPSFRFDTKLLDVYHQLIEKLGIQVYYHKEWGYNFFLEDLCNYKYIIMALGTSLSKNVLHRNAYLLNGLDVLSQAKKQNISISKKKVLVIGGGNVAMDVARTLKRLDNQVHIVYRRDIPNAPANKKEIAEALEEGIIFDECLAPSKCIFENHRLIGLEVEKMELITDESSHRKMFKKTGQYQEIDCDYIVEAVGLDADYTYLKKVLPDFFDETGWIIKEGYLKVGQQIFFATGDYFMGASNFANAAKLAKKTVKLLEEFK